jgi:hypothetical protein
MRLDRRLATLRTGAAALILALSPAAARAGEMKLAEAAELVPIGGGWTYQGFLSQSGAPANGAYDFQFLLFDAAAAGSQVGSTVTVSDLAVANGVFSALVNPGGGIYAGGGRWLEIRVRPGASGGAYTPLTPRQFLSPAPVALSLPNVHTNQALNFVGVGRNFQISGNEVFGIRYDGVANEYGGMYVETSHAEGWPFYGFATDGSFRAWTYYKDTDTCPVSGRCPLVDLPGWKLYTSGLRLAVPNSGGLRVGPAADYSIVIENTTGSDGVHIYDTGDDGIQIGSDPDYPNYGVYIPSPGVTAYGLWPNTSEAAGEWALFTVDNIEANNVFALGQTQIARVAGEEELLPGDVVAVAGYANGLVGHHDLVPTVVAAGTAEAEAVIGVVRSRMVLRGHPGKTGEDAVTLHSGAGPAQPGEFVAIVVRGVAPVRVESKAGIAAGQRLTASDLAGRARPLRTRILDGMVVSEGLPSIGVALGPGDDEDDFVPVYVDVR